MKYFYQELTIIPNDDISPNFIMSKIFFKLHVLFGKYKDLNGSNSFGISFPGYIQPGNGCQTLGMKIRVFGPSIESLNDLNLARNLRSWTDYVHIKSPSIVLSEIKGYSTYQRVRPENNIAGLKRRFAKRHNLALEAAEKEYKNFSPKTQPDFPYVTISSSSSGNTKFSLLIKKEEKGYPVFDDYSTYGLSSTATVPEF